MSAGIAARDERRTDDDAGQATTDDDATGIEASEAPETSADLEDVDLTKEEDVAVAEDAVEAAEDEKERRLVVVEHELADGLRAAAAVSPKDTLPCVFLLLVLEAVAARPGCRGGGTGRAHSATRSDTCFLIWPRRPLRIVASNAAVALSLSRGADEAVDAVELIS